MSTSLRPAVQSARPVGRGAPASFIKHAGDVAQYFGFRPVRELEQVRERSAYTFAKASAVCGAAAKPQAPALAYFAAPTPSHHTPELRLSAKPNEYAEFGLVVSGPEESLSEIVLVRTVTTILAEWGATVSRVRLNAMGDKDSRARFSRELSGYLRKHADALDEHCRAAASADPAHAYLCTTESCRELLRSGPRPMNFLSEKSRAHFREVLEHVEHLGLPYELDDMLIGDERESRMTFAVDVADDATVLSTVGGRYDEHIRRLHGAKSPATTAASIYFRKGGLPASTFAALPKALVPKVYFVQLGLRAKLQGLGVVDQLRRAHMPLLQSFDARSLAPQLAAAKAAGVRYIIIMGAREALDNTVLIRTIDNSSQDIVPLKELQRHLRGLK